MQRITVAIHPDGQRSFTHEAYQNVPGASIIYFPVISPDILTRLRIAIPEDVQNILRSTANL